MRRLLRYRLEYALLWPMVRMLGALPRPAARAVAQAIGGLFYALAPRLRRVARRNLTMAMPHLSAVEQKHIVRGVFRNLARMLAEFALFPRYTRANVGDVIVPDGFENYTAALRRGRGVIFLTGHLGAWELGAFGQSIYGHPLHVVIRALDNPWLNEMVNRYRALGGNRIIEKRDFLRGILEALKKNEVVGILMDQNSSPTEGVFVDFFGVKACTATGMARIALRTGAAVVPAFAFWEGNRYRLRFDPALELISTGDAEKDAAANTQLFTKVLEDYIRHYPDQWLWIHRRWKTRPEGEMGLY
jgi:KDO2-lipid IV(A) lauroyltransferase